MHLAEMSPLLFLTDRKVLPNKKALRAGSLCGAVEACCKCGPTQAVFGTDKPA